MGQTTKVAAILLNNNNDVFIGKNADTNEWHCIEGDINDGASTRSSIFYAIYEQLHIPASKLLLINQSPNAFDANSMIYKWFLIRVLGEDNVELQSGASQLSESKWENYTSVPLLVSSANRSMYEQVFAEFKPQMKIGSPIEGRAVDSSER